MKVLHLPTPVGGNAWGLAQGERLLGLDSRVLVAADNWQGYPADHHLHLERISSTSARVAKLARTFLHIRDRYDVFHFNFGNSLFYVPYQFKRHLPVSFGVFDLADLPFYSKGAKLFVTYSGCDARQKGPTVKRARIAACHDPHCYRGLCNSGRLDAFRRHNIAKMARYVDHMWALNPDLLYFLPQGQSSFLPYSISRWQQLQASRPRREGKLKVVHAPTNREAKGSDFILRAVQRIEEIHPGSVELKMVEHVPHDQALHALQEADLVIDQLLIGWYGAVTVEAMKLGKPVVCRIATEDLHFIPRRMAEELLTTIIQAEPDTIYEVLWRCAEDRDFLQVRAEASLNYVHRWHQPEYVASLTKERYDMSGGKETASPNPAPSGTE